MAFDILYIIKAVDQFSSVAAQINKSYEGLISTHDRMGRAIAQTTVLQSKFNGVVTTGVIKNNKLASASDLTARSYRDLNSALGMTNLKKAGKGGFLGIKSAGLGNNIKKAANSQRVYNRELKGMQKIFRNIGGIPTATYTRLEASTKKVTKAQTKLNRKWHESITTGKAFGSILTSMRFRLASYATTLALTTLSLRKLIELGKEYEEQFFEMKALTGFNADEMNRLAGSAFRLSKALGVATPEMIKAMRLVTAKRPELITSRDLKGVVSLAKWAGILTTKELSTAEATKALGDALNIFNLEINEAGRVANVLAALSRFSPSEVHETARSIIKAGAAANAAGLSIEQLGAMVGVLTLAGLKSQTAGVGLTTVLIRMMKAGIKLGKNLTLKDVFADVNDEVTRLMTQQEKIVFMAKLYGIRQFKTGFQLQKNADVLGTMQDLITGTDVATEQALTRLEKYEKISQSISNFWEKMGVDIFKHAKFEIIALKKEFARMLILLNHIFESPTLIAGLVNITQRLIWTVNSLLAVLSLLKSVVQVGVNPIDLSQGAAKAALEFLKLSRLLDDVGGIEQQAIDELKALGRGTGIPGTPATAETPAPASVKATLEVNIKDSGNNVSSTVVSNQTPGMDTGVNFIF